jgi:hypothetical protein
MTQASTDSEPLLVPANGTEAARAYFEASRADINLFNFIIDTVLVGDYAVHIARQALKLEGKVESVDPTDLARMNPGVRTRFLRKNSQALLEMFVARSADNFQKYLVDLVRRVLRAKPEILSTRQQTLALEEILKYQRIEDLVHDVIERKVNALSYEGFVELQSWCEERGIEIPVADRDREAVVELIATRNVIAHNRGMVDERYVQTAIGSGFSVGRKRDLEVDDLFNALQLFHRIVANADSAATRKFHIPTVPLPERAPTPNDTRSNETSNEVEPPMADHVDAEPPVAGDAPEAARS